MSYCIDNVIVMNLYSKECAICKVIKSKKQL